jgi:SET domain
MCHKRCHINQDVNQDVNIVYQGDHPKMSSVVITSHNYDHDHIDHQNHHYFDVRAVARENNEDDDLKRSDCTESSCDDSNDVTVGCFARCDIPRHTIIWIETAPLLSGELLETALQRHESGQHNSQEDDDMFLQNNDHFTVSIQQRYLLWQMHDQYIPHYRRHRSGSGCGRGHPPSTTTTTEKRIWGIFYSNAFYNDDMQCSALYYTASKFNHSCSPNVGYDFDGWNMRLWTTRMVHKGEELLDCYSDVVYHQPIDKRRWYLWTKYQFWCTCPKCRLEDVDDDEEDNTQNDKADQYSTHHHAEQSNNQRMRLQQIAQELYQHVDGAEILYSPALEQEVDRIMMQEDNITMSQNDFYQDAVVVNEVSKRMEQRQQQQQQQQQYSSLSNIKNNNNNKKKSEPKPRHLDLLLEYLDLLQQEGLDHDTLDVWVLTYELATFLNATHILHHYQVRERCCYFYQLHKGEHHPHTRAFFRSGPSTYYS